ncbi:LLM class flavin-dependent oxidoreductase [Streptomyces sp. NPDC047976]|uniref:LLM class flavin-dependent oxidoreductase n=1 Tax=Streptomyces sp. NPDC047976 TaxID=3155746 RepID=UPI0034281D8E
MDLDVLDEIDVPRPWHGAHPYGRRAAEQRAYREAVWGPLPDGVRGKTRLADRMGFRTVRAVEHHFREGRSHCPAPEVLLGRLAGLTERIRLGFGVPLTPFGFTPPQRIAEKVATVDGLSGGRVEWGTGRSGGRCRCPRRAGRSGGRRGGAGRRSQGRGRWRGRSRGRRGPAGRRGRGPGLRVLCADVDPGRAAAVAAEVGGVPHTADVTRREAVRDLFAHAPRLLGAPSAGWSTSSARPATRPWPSWTTPAGTGTAPLHAAYGAAKAALRRWCGPPRSNRARTGYG